MKHLFIPLTVIAMTIMACSSPEPPKRFLTAPMCIAFTADGQKKAERLKIRPVDLYNIFDRDVKGKKWKKIHENSWAMIIDGRDAAGGKVNRMVITLLVDPDLNDMIVVKEMKQSGQVFSSEEAANIIRALDKAFNPLK